MGANLTRPIGRLAESNQSGEKSWKSFIYSHVELNRYAVGAVGAGEWIEVDPRFVSCKCGGLPGSDGIDCSEDSDLRQADL